MAPVDFLTERGGPADRLVLTSDPTAAPPGKEN